MTNTQNINTMKSTMIVLATVLALVAAALLQTKAEAATAQVSSGSIEDAKPAGADLPKGSGKAVKATSQPKTQSSDGTLSTRSTTMSYNGRPGSLGLYPIQASAYDYGYQKLTTAAANINRSPSYAGDQVITMRTRIFKQDYQNGTYYPWTTWLSKAYSVRVGPGQMAQMPRQWFQSSDISGNRYEADVQVAWRTPGGTLLASQNILLNNSRDFQCVSSNCLISGTEGSRIFVNLDYHYSGI
jgi:hypothetical protein